MTPSSDAPVPAGVATLFDQGRVANTAGRPTEAERLLRESVALLEVDYPGSAALLSAQARLAHYLARSGQAQAARDLYRTIIAANVDAGTGSSVVRRSLERGIPIRRLTEDMLQAMHEDVAALKIARFILDSILEVKT